MTSTVVASRPIAAHRRHSIDLEYCGWMNDEHWFIDLDNSWGRQGQVQRYSVPFGDELTSQERDAMRRHAEAKKGRGE